MNHSVTKGDIVGKTIARILQTEWEHLEGFSHCEFYVEFTNGTLLGFQYDSLLRIDADDRMLLRLRDVEIDSDFPAFFSSDGFTGVGATIEKVLTTSYDEPYLLLSGQYYLTSELEECQTALSLLHHQEFLYYARISEFFDYWTKEPYIFNNMRAIDVIVKSNVDDLDLWQSSELFLTIGRVWEGEVRDRLAVPNKPKDNGWSARFVVPEVGIYRIFVKRRQGEFFADVHINEFVIAEGRVEICVV